MILNLKIIFYITHLFILKLNYIFIQVFLVIYLNYKIFQDIKLNQAHFLLVMNLQIYVLPLLIKSLQLT